MATVKVFMPTYRRNNTLVRSIDSLLKQTFTNWICEVHNDDPDDKFPGNYIAGLNDTRFSIINHPVNFGAVKTFNLAYDNCDETYLSILEDDNWWQPDFLETMVDVMESHKNVQVAWANMHLWQEEPGNKWIDIQKTIWPVIAEKITTFNFPHYKQAFTALHSIGAMFVRNKDLNKLKVPESSRLDLIEPIRERAYQHPMLLVNKPLANFALTLNTSRQPTIEGLYEQSLLLIDSFFTCVEPNDEYAKLLWADAREKKLRSYNRLLYTGLTCKSSRKLLKFATLKEWSIFILYNFKYPFIMGRCLNAKKTYAELWAYLLTNTRNRAEETKINEPVNV